ncbi:alpha/beta fold hydrolase [Streptomyces sp. NPDC005480]|uniref:alpha/beta fold hydrolase n=1 Tax=Streptomyces sp. NPDC005480 TaxID=3154880 RepID=UPI0033A4E516
MPAYDIRGSGPGLVLLPGIGGTPADIWGTLAADLAAENTVVLMDLPGAGNRPLPGGPLDAGAVADHVVTAVQEAGLRDFVIAGASLGAAVAVKAAARHPGTVRGLCTLSGFARPRTSLWLSLEMWASLHARRDVKLNSFLASLLFSEGYLAGLGAEKARLLTARLVTSGPGIARQLALAQSLDLRSDLPTVAAPTLVVAATADRFVAPEYSVELADGIPGARLAAVGSGHAATLEEPERTLEILTGFLRTVRRDGFKGPFTKTVARGPASSRPRLLPTIPSPRSPYGR